MRRWILPNAHTTNTRGIMTNNRSNNQQMEERVNYAADQLAKGKRAMDISKKLAKKYNVSIQQARDYVRQAKPVLTCLLYTSPSPRDPL